MLTLRSFLGGYLWLVVSLGARVALASEDNTASGARATAKEGLIALDEGRYEEAATKLAQAYRTVQVPTLAVFTARALANVGKLVEASALYQEALQLDAGGTNPRKQHQARRDAEREREALQARIPRLIVNTQGTDPEAVELSIDSKPVPRPWMGVALPVNPGTHLVMVQASNARTSKRVTLAEGDEAQVMLTFAAQPALSQLRAASVADTINSSVEVKSPASKWGDTRTDLHREKPSHLGRTLTWVGFGIAGAGIAVGGTLAAIARSRRSSLDANGCENSHCYFDQQSDVDSYNVLVTGSTIGFAVGALGLTGATVLLLTRGASASPKTGIAVRINSRQIGIGGEF